MCVFVCVSVSECVCVGVRVSLWVGVRVSECVWRACVGV